MERTVKLNELTEVLATLSYPTTRAVARRELDDVRLQYADGDEPLTGVLERTPDTTFADADELESEIRANLPIEAVGEPGQSEGEG
jgi:hypothetical protein